MKTQSKSAEKAFGTRVAKERCMTEKELLRGLRDQCPGAFDRVVRDNAPRLRTLGVRILKCEFEAEDALQDTLMCAIRGLHRFDGRSAVSSWLYRIMINNCRMRLRTEAAQRRALHALAQDPCASETDTPWARAVARDQLERLGEMLSELPGTYREVVELRVLRDFDTSTAAKTLGVQEGVVKVRLHRARRMLRELARERQFVLAQHDLS